MSTLAPLQWLGIGILIAYAVWLVVFFGRVRPWLMSALGRRLGLQVAEDLDGEGVGTYGTRGTDVSVRSHWLVWSADLATVLAGTVGVALLVFVPTFLVAESGALLPLEGRLTGHRVTFELEPTARMRASQATASLNVTVHNEGSTPESMCLLSVADYQARNGYLAGRSAFFDLKPGAQRSIDVPLRASRPPVGSHAFRVKLECSQERLMVQSSSLRVDP